MGTRVGSINKPRLQRNSMAQSTVAGSSYGRGRRAYGPQPHGGLRRPTASSNSGGKSSGGGRGKSGAGTEASIKRLRETLRQAEAQQAANWVRKQHKAIDHDLNLTATRLESADSLTAGKPPTSPSFWQTTPVMPTTPPLALSDTRAREPAENTLANTWFSAGVSGMRVDGRGLQLSKTTPSRSLRSVGRPTAIGASSEENSGAGSKNATETLIERVRTAMALHEMDVSILKEFILPSTAVDPKETNCTTVRAWEVFKVLALDLGLELSDGDKELLSREFGDGEDGGRIDAGALLVALGLESSDISDATGPKLTSLDALAQKSASSARRNTPERFRSFRLPREGGPSPRRRNEKETPARYRSEPKGNGSEEGEKEGVASAPLDAAEETADPDLLAARRNQADGEPPAYEDVMAQRLPSEAEERSLQGDDPGNSTDHGDFSGEERGDGKERFKLNPGGGGGGGDEDDHPEAEGAAASRAAETGAAAGNAIEATRAVEEENARLRSELEVFDLGFFEEVEDLKYSYAALRREAEKLARRQGVNLTASLGLPEEGEEPWDRTIDVAHHLVDWAETSRRQALSPGGSSPGSPPRGAHATRLARHWDRLSFAATDEGKMEAGGGGEGFPLGSARRGRARNSPRINGTSRQRPGERRFGTPASEAAEPVAVAAAWNGFVAAHERKLAWELSTGGMDSLRRLRELAGRVDRSGEGFGSDEEVCSALQRSGYALEVEDVAVLRTGLGISADGKIDVKEFMGMCEDIASSQGWYVPASAAAAASLLSPAISLSPDTRSGAAADVDGAMLADMFLRDSGGRAGGGVGGALGPPVGHLRGAANGWLHGSATGFSPSPSTGPGAHYVGDGQLFFGGTVYGEKSFLQRPKNADEVVAEVKDQLALLDTGRFFPRSVLDTASGGSGIGKAGAAATLGQAVGARFSRRDPALSGLLSARELGLALEDVGVSLRPGEVLTLARRFKPPGEGPQPNQLSGDGNDDCGELDGVIAEYAPVVRLVVDYLAEAAAGGGARLGRAGEKKWNERMPALAMRLKAALSSGGSGSGWLDRLRQRFRDFDIDGDGCLGRRAFMRALNLALSRETGNDSDPSPEFTVGGLVSEQEATELMYRLDRDRDGRVCWELFFEYFADTDRAGGGVGSDVGGAPEAWFQQEREIAEKLLQHLELQGGVTVRRAWIDSLRRRFLTADVQEVGALEREDFLHCLRSMRVPLSAREGAKLFSVLLPVSTDAGGASYPALIDFLRSNNGKWYEVERGIAEKILQAMGPDSVSRRAWLNRIRRRFMSLDAFRVGVLGASDLLQALKDGGCYLGLDEEARLLDALETEESARFDTEGGVSYRELLMFCARHAGRWNDVQPALAERLGEALRSQAKTAGDVRRLFRRLDDDGDGLISRKDFKVALHRLGFGFATREEQEELMDALDSEGSGRVRYADFSAFFGRADSWFMTDADLVEKLCKGLEDVGEGGGPGTVLDTIRERFVAEDRKKKGFLDAAQFRAVLAGLPGTEGLTVDEVDRLTALLDDNGDGRVSYRSLLGMLVRHLGDWSKRLPEVAAKLSLALQNVPYGLKACVGNLARRIDIADHTGAGRLPPSTLGRCMRSVGLTLEPERLQEMVAVMDAYGDGLIPTAPILGFLRKEAGLAAPEPSAASKGGVAEGPGGEVGSAFRDAVRSLARAENEYARPDYDDSDDYHGYDDDGNYYYERKVPRNGAVWSGFRRNSTSSRSNNSETRSGRLEREKGAMQKRNRAPSSGLREGRRGGKIGTNVDGQGVAALMQATIPWHTCLRRVFDRRLDLDGDGYLTEGDLVACLPEIGVDVDSRDGARTLLTAMDSRRRGLGQATFKEFVEFVDGIPRTATCVGLSETPAAPLRGGFAVKAYLEPGLQGLVRQVRRALGLSLPPRLTPAADAIRNGDDPDGAVTRDELRLALARLDPQRSGRLPLGKIKAALQSLGLEVGRVPRAWWLNLTDSLDQDAYGHIFYADLADLLIPPPRPLPERPLDPPPTFSRSSPGVVPSREGTVSPRTQRRASWADPGSRGLAGRNREAVAAATTSPRGGGYGSSGRHGEKDDGSDSCVGGGDWGATTYPAATASSRSNDRQKDRTLERRRELLVGRDPTVGRRRTPVPDERYSGRRNHGDRFIQSQSIASESPSSDTGRRGAGVRGRSNGDPFQQRPGRTRTKPRSSVRFAAAAGAGDDFTADGGWAAQGESRPTAARRASGSQSRRGPASTALRDLAERILDGVCDEHGGAAEGGKALRSALRRQDLTRSGRLSQGEFRLAMDSAGAPLSANEITTLFRHFDKGGTGTLDRDRFADWVLRKSHDEELPVNGVDGPAGAVLRALKAQGPNVKSMRRRLKEIVDREQQRSIGGVEFKRLLQSSGLELAPHEISYLRRKCGDASGQVNTLALLACLEPPGLDVERPADQPGGDARGISYDSSDQSLRPESVLRGRSQQRHQRPTSFSSTGRGGKSVDGGATSVTSRRANSAAGLRRPRARERNEEAPSPGSATEENGPFFTKTI